LFQTASSSYNKVKKKKTQNRLNIKRIKKKDTLLTSIPIQQERASSTYWRCMCAYFKLSTLVIAKGKPKSKKRKTTNLPRLRKNLQGTIQSALIYHPEKLSNTQSLFFSSSNPLAR
jgi:hypothetical protein